jgi:hypothetical protein
MRLPRWVGIQVTHIRFMRLGFSFRSVNSYVYGPSSNFSPITYGTVVEVELILAVIIVRTGLVCDEGTHITFYVRMCHT